MKCIVCNLEIENEDTLYSVFSINFSKFCDACKDSFHSEEQTTNFKGFNVTSLYKYNDFAKNVLNRYKTKGDITLSKIFAILIKKYLKKKYKNYLVVLAPSSKTRINKLMFNHLEEVIKKTNLKYLKIISKVEDDKQSEQTSLSRSKERHFKFNSSIDIIFDKKILIFDDILTSGSTMITIQNLFQDIKVKNIEYFSIFKA